MCLEFYHDPAKQAAFKKTKVELALTELELTNTDMLLIVEKEIRRGSCHSTNGYAKPNKKYLKDYNK